MVDQRAIHHDRPGQNSSSFEFKTIFGRQHRVNSCGRAHMHYNQSLIRIKRCSSNGSVPPVAAELSVVFITIAKLKRSLKHLLRMHPIPANVVLIEKFGKSQRQIFTGNHTADDMLRI